MQAVVMAAGEGRRLRPLTGRFAKPVLPVDGRPVVVTLLRELAASGLAPLTVVVGHLGGQVEALVAPFSGVSVAVQPEPLGSADAVLRAGVEPPYVAVAADTVFTPGEVGRFVDESRGFDGALAVRRSPGPVAGHRPGVRVENGLVRRVVDGAGGDLSAAPLWLVGKAVAREFGSLPGPPFELAAAVQRAVDGGARIAAVEIGPTRDLTDPLDLAVENFDYLRAL